MAEFSYKGKVRWSETDASGLFHFPTAFMWAEDAEHELYRTALPGFAFSNLPRRTVSATYSAPFRAGDAYEVRLWVTKIGTSSITFGWTVMRGETIAVEGQHTVVHLGPDFKPSALPDNLRAGMERYQKSEAS